MAGSNAASPVTNQRTQLLSVVLLPAGMRHFATREDR